MLTTNQLKSLQIEKTKLFLKNHNYIFFVHWTPSSTTDIKNFKRQFEQIEKVSLLKIKNTIFVNSDHFQNLNLPKIEGPNLFLGCKNSQALNKIYNLLNKTSNIILIGACIDQTTYNHLELKIYFEHIFNKNVHLGLLQSLYSSSAIHMKLGFLESLQLFQLTTQQISEKEIKE